jgi:hypothetical protein
MLVPVSRECPLCDVYLVLAVAVAPRWTTSHGDGVVVDELWML